jgi:hypothetical protein
MVALWGSAVVYAAVLSLHLILPGRWVDGYLRDPATGSALRYRLNGPLPNVEEVKCTRRHWNAGSL